MAEKEKNIKSEIKYYEMCIKQREEELDKIKNQDQKSVEVEIEAEKCMREEYDNYQKAISELYDKNKNENKNKNKKKGNEPKELGDIIDNFIGGILYEYMIK
jgi:hypothetical protein